MGQIQERITFSAEIVKSGTIRLTSLLECMFRAISAFSLKVEFVVCFPMHLIKLCPPILMYVVNDCIVVMYIVHSCTVDAAAFGTNIKFVRKLVIPAKFSNLSLVFIKVLRF